MIDTVEYRNYAGYYSSMPINRADIQCRCACISRENEICAYSAWMPGMLLIQKWNKSKEYGIQGKTEPVVLLWHMRDYEKYEDFCVWKVIYSDSVHLNCLCLFSMAEWGSLQMHIYIPSSKRQHVKGLHRIQLWNLSAIAIDAYECSSS